MKRIRIKQTNGSQPSGVVISVCLYIALMMVQTPIMQIGRITAISTTIFVITACLFSGRQSFRRFRISYHSGALILFSVLLFMTTFIHQDLDMEMFEVVAMIVVTIFLCSITISQDDDATIRRTFELSITVYAILVIRSCIENIETRYYHGDIELFGTLFDPNHIGIPFVAATVLILNNILNRKHFFSSGICYIIIAVAIVFTASRGSMTAWFLSNSLMLYYQFRSRGVSLGRKLFWAFMAIILVIGLIRFFSTGFEEQWKRMTTFGEGSDNGRFDLWLTSLSLWLKNPLFGVGYNGMYHYSGAASHNTYLQILSETGLLGFCLIVFFLYHLVSKAYRENRVQFCLLMGLLAQIALLDALGNRCVWAILAWCVLKHPKPEMRVSSC